MVSLLDYGFIEGCTKVEVDNAEPTVRALDRARITPRGIEGSSPRVRGAARFCPPSAATAGIIPACAGSSSGMMIFLKLTSDHPRVCGEQTWG